MITLLKNLKCYAPEYIGKKNILIAQNKIFKIFEDNVKEDFGNLVNIIDCDGLLAFPGIIDSHVHIIGGGGEKGFASRIDEIKFQDIVSSGVTTVVGLLGADDVTKNMISMLAKSKGLEEQGITTYIYSGSYSIPLTTITKNLTHDMVLIDKVIGAGEVAIADHRSSYPSIKELIKISTEAHLGSLITGKAGLVHMHIGDSKTGLNLLTRVLDETELPIEMFLPTHTNRNEQLFKQAIKYVKSGGNIDLTAGEEIGLSVPDALKELISNKIDLAHVTISSDANGSFPNNKIGKSITLFEDIICCIENGIKPEIVFPLVTKNVAKRLKLYPKKGTLKEGSDADILLLDESYNIKSLYSLGKLVFKTE
ncbi:beta-aspartyl-peptidase [Treponema sp. R6D11]